MIENLDPLPFPAKHLIPMDKYDFLWPVDDRMLRARGRLPVRTRRWA